MLNRGFQTVCALVLCLFLSGCGGSDKAGSTSLSDQYQKAMQITDLNVRTTQLLSVSGKQKKAGDLMGAEQSLASAAVAAKGIEDVEGRAAALNRVAGAMARSDVTKAKNLLKEVRKASEEIDDPEAKVSVLSRMAYGYGKYLEDKEVATAYLEKCQEIAATVSRPEGKIEAMLAVVYIYYGLEEAEKMQSLLEQTLETARSLEDTRKRADSIATAAAFLVKMKKTDEAKGIFGEAQKEAGKIEDPLSQAYSLIHLSEKLNESNLKGAARTVLGQAEKTADKVTDQSMRGPLIEKIYAARTTL